VLYTRNHDRQVWGLNSGCLLDATAYAFAYGRLSKAKPVIGISTVTLGVAEFYPMELDSSGRWTGRVPPVPR